MSEEVERREALSQSWDKSAEQNTAVATDVAPEPVETPAPVAEPAPISEPAPEAPADRARAADGKFVPKAEASKPGVVAPAAAIGTPPPAAPAFKAPQSWKPEAREAIAKLPPEVAKLIMPEIERREREHGLGIQRSTEMQRAVEPLLRAVQPFAQSLQQRGQDPATVVSNFLRTEQALSHPDERQRAQVLVQAMRTYNVSAEAFADAYGGTPAPAGQQTTAALDPRLITQQVTQNVFNALQQQSFQNATAQAEMEIENYRGEAEFLDDVGLHMAALMDPAINGGLAVTKESAYEQACWANPRIRGILQQREASKQAATGAQATQRARAASSSVKNTPGSMPNGSPSGDDWRAHLEAAAEKAGWK